LLSQLSQEPNDSDYVLIQRFQQSYEDIIRRAQLLFEKLEVSEKKRQETLAQSKLYLQSKLELEMLLLAERKRCAEILDGKGSAVLKEKITVLEVTIREQQAKDKEVKTRERMHKQRTEELVKEVRETKAEMERRLSELKKGS
jgi:hypothetical protein